MALDSASVESRSNSDLTCIGMVMDNFSLSSSERMALILRIAQGWDRATEGSTGRYGANRVLPTHWDNGIRREGEPLRTHQ
jgi:hypothetical protein